MPPSPAPAPRGEQLRGVSSYKAIGLEVIHSSAYMGASLGFGFALAMGLVARIREVDMSFDVSENFGRAAVAILPTIVAAVVAEPVLVGVALGAFVLGVGVFIGRWMRE